MKKVGDKIDIFTLPDHNGNNITVGKTNKKKILFFFPKASTAG